MVLMNTLYKVLFKEIYIKFLETGSPNEYWKLTKSSIKIKEKANMFSPGNTRCMGENPPY